MFRWPCDRYCCCGYASLHPVAIACAVARFPLRPPQVAALAFDVSGSRCDALLLAGSSTTFESVIEENGGLSARASRRIVALSVEDAKGGTDLGGSADVAACVDAVLGVCASGMPSGC
jgi:hypothetical protein